MVSREAPAPWPLLASLLALGAMLTLFALRPLDDNRLTSWLWVFQPMDGARLAFWLVVAVLLATIAGAAPLQWLWRGPVLAACAFGTSALLWPTPEVIVDAARHFAQAKAVSQLGPAALLHAWGTAIPAWTDLPLVPALYGSVIALFGEQRAHLQALNSALFAGTVWLTWRIGRMLWDEEAGLIAATLLLGMPYLLVQVPLTLADVPTMFFVTLATFATLLALRGGGALRVALAAGAIALAGLTKYSAWLMLTVLPVLAVAEALSGTPRAMHRAAAIAAGALLLVAALLLQMLEVVSAQIGLLRDFQAPALGRWEESLVSTFLFQSHPFIALAAVASAGLAWRARDARFAAVAWLPLLLLVIGVRRARYVVPMMPMLALMAAYGLRAIRAAPMRRHVVRCVVATSLVIVFCGFAPFLKRTSAANLAEAGMYLDSLGDAAVEVLALPQRAARLNPEVALPLLDLHTGKRLVAESGRLPPPADVASLPLRFTWDFHHAAAYGGAREPARALPVAVVADALAAEFPPALAARLARHRLAREFAASEHVFGYQTLVSIYLPEAADGR